MKLWKLEPNTSDPAVEPHAYPPKWDYDMNHGHVIRASTEADARRWADFAGRNENKGGKHPWLDPLQTTCLELAADGDEGIVLTDYQAG